MPTGERLERNASTRVIFLIIGLDKKQKKNWISAESEMNFLKSRCNSTVTNSQCVKAISLFSSSFKAISLFVQNKIISSDNGDINS